jgi:broad specificity phosphatase PhoE
VTLVLCRHAEAGNAEQAQALADALGAVPVTAVYTSPLARALETARPIAETFGLAPVEVDELREIDFGAVEGLTFDAFPAALRDGLLREPLATRFPGGETYGELRQRVCRALRQIVVRHPDATVVVVTHAGSIRAALGAWLGIGGEEIFRIDQRHAAVNVVDWIDGAPIVRLVNGTRPSG